MFAAVQSGAGDGFGVMLGDGLGCWDLDKCIDGDVLAPWARDVLVGIEAPLFVEVSMSGTGLHVFVESPEGPGRRCGGVEFYSRARFIRLGTPMRRGELVAMMKGSESYARTDTEAH